MAGKSPPPVDTAKSGQRVEWLRALRRLDVAWRRSHTQRANGGRYALAGFKCQFDFLLRDLIASWLSGAPVSTVFAEVISDFTEASEEGLFVTQVKRRQTSSAVTEALTELWEIDCVAEAEGSMPGPLRYRILSARCELKDVSATLARWTPDAPVDPDRLTDRSSRRHRRRIPPARRHPSRSRERPVTGRSTRAAARA
jgi:hypothetical protein